MKNKVISTYATFGGLVLSTALILACYLIKFETYDLFINIGYALFSASSITIIISLVEYRTLKREKVQQFIQQCNKFRKLVNNISYLHITEHEFATVKYMQLKPLADSDSEDGVSFLQSLKDEDIEFKNCSIEGYRFELEMYSKELETRIGESIQSYLAIGYFDADVLQLLQQDIVFLFHKKDETIFKDIYAYINNLLNELKKYDGFFRWYVSGKRTQINDVLDRLSKANSHFFKCIDSDGGTTIYSTTNDKLLTMINKMINLISKDEQEEVKTKPYGFVSKNLANNNQ